VTTVFCDECETTMNVDSLYDVTKHPSSGMALCEDCEDVQCKSCHRSLNVADLSSDHEHESGGWVCDTCPSVETPYHFDIVFRREPEGFVPHWIGDVFPDVRVSGDYNADSISRQWWRIHFRVTFRWNGDGIEPVAINGKPIEGVDLDG